MPQGPVGAAGLRADRKAVNSFQERFRGATVGRLGGTPVPALDDLIADDAGTDAESAGG
ncbi:hypothetical protein P3L51_32660 [Streptomyces sp. PSRA5]|uniref:hypothetical protein n=1 Tax=Streptomyces panacea TaxID=3035064 RepID=UPI00339C6D50